MRYLGADGNGERNSAPPVRKGNPLWMATLAIGGMLIATMAFKSIGHEIATRKKR